MQFQKVCLKNCKFKNFILNKATTKRNQTPCLHSTITKQVYFCYCDNVLCVNHTKTDGTILNLNRVYAMKATLYYAELCFI